MLKIGMSTYIWVLSLPQKNRWFRWSGIYIVHKWYMSYRVSYNSAQTLRFKYHITFYEHVWTSNLDITLYLP